MLPPHMRISRPIPKMDHRPRHHEYYFHGRRQGKRENEARVGSTVLTQHAAFSYIVFPPTGYQYQGCHPGGGDGPPRPSWSGGGENSKPEKRKRNWKERIREGKERERETKKKNPEKKQKRGPRRGPSSDFPFRCPR